MRTLSTLLLIAVIAIVTKEGTSRYLLVEVDNKETSDLRQKTCPLENIAYGDTNSDSVLVYFQDGISTWQACGSLCANLLQPEGCKFWTWLPLDAPWTGGSCTLFSNDDALHASDGFTSGNADCYE